MGGSNTPGSYGVYGVQGVPAAANVPGGRTQPVSSTDSKGNLWLFGGEGPDSVGNYGYLNDLWEFNPSTSQWTWIGGSSTLGGGFNAGVGVYGTLGTPGPANIPSGRSGAVSWSDNKGNLWIFGGFNYTVAGTYYFSDLWKFDPTTNQWAWMSGPNTANQPGIYGTLGTAAAANTPGARNNAVAVADAKGNLWLFGGTGGGGNFSDLWKFDTSTNQWTWVSGSNIANQAAVPGTLHQAAAGNIPASRNGATGWSDLNGNIWIFGGVGIGSTGAGIGSFLNDLWEFNPTTSQWAWMSGNPTVAYPQTQPGVYGTLQTPAAANVPGSRTGAVSWTDSKGNLWMFGGVGFESRDFESLLNDLWEFNPSIGEWAWMGGLDAVPQDCAYVYNFCGQPGVFGTLQTAAFLNTPGGRYQTVSWTDSKGNFWLFGGEGVDKQDNEGYLNDLWEFQPNTGASSVTATPIISPGSGTYTSTQTVTISDTTPGATISYSINGNAPALPYASPITVSSSETIEAIASASGYANSNIAAATYVANLPQAARPQFSIASGTYATAQTVAIVDTTPGATIYYAIGAIPTTASSVYSGPITVSTSEAVEAIAVATNYTTSSVATAAYNIGVNAPAQWTWMGGSKTIPVCSTLGSCAAPSWYGSLQTFAAANMPAARVNAVSWTDNSGNFWLFGGQGNQSTLNDLWEFKPSVGQWAWMAGSNVLSTSHAGVYGTLGTPAAGNTPGSRSGAAGWTDTHGNLWLFGGFGFDANGMSASLNDVWKFTPSTNQWTWMGGGSTVGCALHTLCDGQSGVYGTLGTPAATNIPGGRNAAVTWTDHNGNFWLYSGVGLDSRGNQCYPDDLWEFNPNTNQWTWMGGSQFCSNLEAGYPGLYDDVGVPALVNYPWSLTNATSWTDKNGKLWVFGGSGEDDLATGYILNDMWEYDPSINQWIFTDPNSVGAPGGSPYGTYGTLGNWSPADIPGERSRASSWTDSDGNFWMFGGYGLPFAFPDGALNDLWEFKPLLNEWAWMGGSNTVACLVVTSGVCVGRGEPGAYGVLGTPAPGNTPGSRNSAATWTDSSGNLWLFGGYGYDASVNDGYLNDMWQYSLKSAAAVAPPVPAATPVLSLTAGTYATAQTLTISDATPGATIYYTTDGTTPNSTSAVYAGQILIASSETVEAIAVASNYALSGVATAAYTITIPQAATPTFSVPAGTYTSAQTVTLSDATAGATIYYTTNGSTPSTTSAVYSSPIAVSATETIEAIAFATGYSNSAVASAAYTITLPPTFTLQAAPTSLTVVGGSAGTVTLTVTPQHGFNSAVTFACPGLPIGAACSFSPSTVTPSGSAATSTLTITTIAHASLQPGFRSTLGEVTLAFTFILFGWRRRRLPSRLLLAVAFLGLAFVSGCSGGGTPSNGGGGGGGPTPVTSTVTITATGASIQQTAQITLTVD